MSYLRFTKSEYRYLRRLSRNLSLDGLDPFAVAAFLTACLSERFPGFASRFAKLTDFQARILVNHLQRMRRAEARPVKFTKKDLRAITVACETFPLTSRFLQHLRRWLVQLLQEVFPDLAKKVSSLSDGQFERLHAHVKARKYGNP